MPRAHAAGSQPERGRFARLGFALGVLAVLLTLVLEPPEGLGVPAWRLVGVALLMACWWITEAIPIPATALVPLALFPLLDIASIRDAGEPYGHRVVFLLMGGFMIALAMQRWDLHRRIALNVVSRVGGGPRRIVAGFMLPAAFLSMWISNTAAATMMVPIGLSVLAMFEQDPGISDRGKTAFGCALMLGIAFAANVGGMSTLIGTPPNAVLAGVLQETFGYQVGFVEWLAIGLPMTVVFLPLIWVVLTRVCFPVPGGSAAHHHARLAADTRALGPLSRAEITVLLTLLVTALLWLTRRTLNELAPNLAINDTSIAVCGALALFLLPVGRDAEGRREFALDWATAMRLPWGVLLLLGGGFSLAAAIKATGLAAWIGDSTAVVAVLPLIGLLFLVTLLIVLLTEINSNTATTATFIPVLAAVAVSIGENPLLLCIPATFAASAAFMLPIATAPNAVVFASGHVPSSAMLRAGLFLNPLATLVIVTLAWFLLGPALGVVPGELPDWAVNPD